MRLDHLLSKERLGLKGSKGLRAASVGTGCSIGGDTGYCSDRQRPWHLVLPLWGCGGVCGAAGVRVAGILLGPEETNRARFRGFGVFSGQSMLACQTSSCVTGSVLGLGGGGCWWWVCGVGLRVV